jgi:hypothetical protein
MTILEFDGSLYAKQTYSILPGDLHKIYISAKIASEVLTPIPHFILLGIAPWGFHVLQIFGEIQTLVSHILLSS